MGAERVYDLEDRLISFAVLVCRVAATLPPNREGKHVAGQLVRCGTAAAPNYGEAQSAESRKDFIHKMRVCLKELRETRVWLRFTNEFGIGDPDSVEGALEESGQLVRIFVKSIQTAEANDRRLS
jgi:four helix bundle protein